MEESKCYTLNFIAFYLFTCKSKDLKVPHQVNKNWHWTNIHKVMKHVKNLNIQFLHKAKRKNTMSDGTNPSKVSERETILESHMLLKQENSPDVAVGSPGFIIEQSQSQATLRNIDADYNSNSFNFSYDGSFSLSPQQSVDMKDLEKSDATSVILSNQPLSNSSLSTGSNASPKSFMVVGINENKSDKMISGFDGRMDGLSPLSVIAVSAYQDAGHPSPSVPSSILSRTHVLRYQPGNDTMLSALSYNDSDMLQEGGFDVSSSHTFNTLDGLLGSTGAGSMRLPDLLDGDMNQEAYMETGQDLQLSPQTFHNSGDTFAVRESSPLTGLNDNTQIKTEMKNKPSESSTLLVDKLKVKGARPAKATSPNRPGTQPCPTCGKVFSNSSALTKHKLTHSDERKYICQLCAKAFKRQDHLNGHMLTHRNKKPFECDAEGCGKSYCDARSLRRHKENHHSNTSSSNLSNQVSVIPGLAHLGFSSLQTSYPASVITSASGPAFTESTSTNRIQYAPPPATTSLASRASSSTNENLSRTVSSSVASSSISTATSQLQFLTFQQQSSTKGQQQLTSSTPKNVARSDSSTVLSSWQPQTINTGALLLAQNFGASQSISQANQSAQLMTRSFDSTTNEQGSSSGSEMSLGLKSESKTSDLLSREASEQNQMEQSCYELMNSSSGAKQLTSQSSVNMPYDSSSGRLQDVGDSMFSRSAMHIVKIEPPDSAPNSVPTTPTTKEVPNGPHLESPLLQQLLNQQQCDVNSGGIINSRSEHSLLSSYSNDQQKQSSSSQQSSVLMSSWSQVPYSGNNTTSNSRYSNQDPKPVECSLCQRKFKNIPALNGHMRLHGGYFKKENDTKKNEKKNNASSHPPLQTASTNVRALIEEKINQKRNFMPQTTIQSASIESSQPQAQTFDFQSDQHSQNPNYIAEPSPVLSPIAQESTVFDSFPTTSQSSDLDPFNLNLQTCDILKKLDLKEQFRVPHPPVEKHRRHSDSDHFILPKRPCATFTNSALADLLRNRVVAKRTCRTGSDPGEPLNLDFALSDFSDTFSDLPKFASSLTNAIDSDLNDHSLTAITPEDVALPVLSAEDIPEAQPMIMSMRDISDLDTPCNVFFDGSNNDLGVGQTFPEISVSELEMMQLTTIVTSTATLSSEMKPVNGGKIRLGDDSNDDDVFLSPTSLPTSPMKRKKKRRPEPIYIPPYVNTSNFHSRLRSPRRLDMKSCDQKNLSPPPYTPPPMLSPVRSGSGLFWHILSGSGSLTPKSAPITPSFGLSRKASFGETTSDMEEEFTEVPESDSVPHVNIGSNYQAKIPPFNPNFKDALLVKHKADKVWDPSTMEFISDEEVETYLDLSCCALISGGGRNKEYALHLLHMCKGNVKDAILSLIDSRPKLPSHHPLLTFQYSENDKWNPEEIEAYHQGLLKCDKDFFSIAKEIPSKSVKQCIQFYYLWKKVCPDEYKRIRLIRRRKEQESLMYNLRSKEEAQEKEEKSRKRNASPSASSRKNEDVPVKHAAVNGSVMSSKSEVKTSTRGNASTVSTSTYNGSGVSSAYDFTIDSFDEYPCKICGKIFSKVKSRSAHMKSHRQSETDRKRYES
ncbi:mitotic deacetylase-associated SANT domain protein [Trichonephila clavata]|uniref:Mitotic deacetylase-associated SANT domain protein n=1 Tax=Trichonephila clavata TaxID=2740835 RepID=A0A8X6KWV9_TRICU|nr:mitotic deacetylase-associated SANT domain protein [Trichonephila clavata]